MVNSFHLCTNPLSGSTVCFRILNWKAPKRVSGIFGKQQQTLISNIYQRCESEACRKFYEHDHEPWVMGLTEGTSPQWNKYPSLTFSYAPRFPSLCVQHKSSNWGLRVPEGGERHSKATLEVSKEQIACSQYLYVPSPTTHSQRPGLSSRKPTTTGKGRYDSSSY